MGWLSDNGGIAYPPCAFDTPGVSTIVGRAVEKGRVIKTASLNGDGTDTESYVVSVEALPGTSILVGRAGERAPAQVGDVVSIWVKSGNMASGFAQALAAYRRDEVEAGDLVAVKYTHDGEAQRGRNAPKQYHVEIQAPQGAASLLGAATQQARAFVGAQGEPFPQERQTTPTGSLLPQGQPQGGSLLP